LPRVFLPSSAVYGTWTTPQRKRCSCLSIVTMDKASMRRLQCKPHKSRWSGTRKNPAFNGHWRGLRFRWSATALRRSQPHAT